MKNSYNKYKTHFVYSINLKSKKILILTLLVVFNISFWITFKIVENNFKPSVTSLATTYSNTYVTSIINKSIKESSNRKINYSDLCKINKNENGEIISVTTDTSAINNIKLKLSDTIIKNLNNTKTQTVGIPVGNLTKTYILLGRGPEIPIKILTTSSPKITIDSKFESTGINQTKHKISMLTTIEIQIILPYETIVKSVSTESLICDTIIIGKVPDVYISK